MNIKEKCFLIIPIIFTLLICGQAFARPTNSCDAIAVSFSKHAFTNQASQTSLTEAVTTAKENGATPQEIICASLGVEGIVTADIINSLRSAGFDPVLIRLAAKDTGLDMGEVASALAPVQKTPTSLPTTVGLTPGKNASPSVP